MVANALVNLKVDLLVDISARCRRTRRSSPARVPAHEAIVDLPVAAVVLRRRSGDAKVQGNAAGCRRTVEPEPERPPAPLRARPRRARIVLLAPSRISMLAVGNRGAARGRSAAAADNAIAMIHTVRIAGISSNAPTVIAVPESQLDRPGPVASRTGFVIRRGIQRAVAVSIWFAMWPCCVSDGQRKVLIGVERAGGC